jgi:subtilisin-like proprotein convertase family protein
MDRYDRNRNGRLEENEWIAVGIAKGEADRNVDGVVTRDELDQWIYSAMDGLASDLSDVLPAWFFERDANGDGQISMDEFADDWSEDKLDEFTSLDADGDGILTTQEMLSSKAVVGGSYVNDKAEVLMPRSVVISEIVVEDDIVIGDLNVQLSITHTYAEYLDGFLIGPDGEQIELFTGVGRNDDHFEDTIFDDEANDRITKSRPPFRGSYRPEARDKNETSLSHYKGKSVQGVWQLMIRSTRSDRAGILHHWSLIVEPAGEDESGSSESESDREQEEKNSAEEGETTSR